MPPFETEPLPHIGASMGEVIGLASKPSPEPTPQVAPPTRRIDTDGYIVQRADPTAILRKMIAQRRGIL